MPGYLNKTSICFLLITAISLSAGENSGRIVVAVCQFPVSADIDSNSGWIKEQMKAAREEGADIMHFPECALSGYAGVDFDDFSDFNWPILRQQTESILELAADLRIWVILGSSHRLSAGNRPHNSLYIINAQGEIVDRYDKRFCTGGDLKHFSPGDHFVDFELNGVKCGLLICYDVRFPELFREYRKNGVQVIFQSFYNARQKPGSIHPKIMPVTAQARAATNYFFMTLTNSSVKHSWPAHFITPDGLIAKKLPADEPGILFAEINTNEKYYDASRHHRNTAINDTLNSGKIVDDPRSRNRQDY